MVLNMPLSNSAVASSVSVPFSIPWLTNTRNGGLVPPTERTAGLNVRAAGRPKYITHSISTNGSSSALFEVSFPRDYEELLEQATQATQFAMEEGKKLMEIEFPTAGLESVSGDGEGGTEMTGSMQLIGEFCDRFVSPDKATRTRVVLSNSSTNSSEFWGFSAFFPEANEVKFARKSAFEGSSLKLDYLTKPSFFEDFGFVEKVKITDRVKQEDELFLVAYPYFNVNEMLVVEELYREAVLNTTRKLIIFNGELDRIRSGWMETVYYIHNFKGRNGGILFRCYPGQWKVLRKVKNACICLHQQGVMPSLKEVALDILPSA